MIFNLSCWSGRSVVVIIDVVAAALEQSLNEKHFCCEIGEFRNVFVKIHLQNKKNQCNTISFPDLASEYLGKKPTLTTPFKLPKIPCCWLIDMPGESMYNVLSSGKFVSILAALIFWFGFRFIANSNFQNVENCWNQSIRRHFLP